MSLVQSCLSTLLTLVLLNGWCREALASPIKVPFSPVLHNPETYQAVRLVAKHAQKLETENDTSVRLMPRADITQHHLEICCLHANILDFYLRDILRSHGNQHAKIEQLKIDLGRVSTDLQSSGCNLTHYHDHQNSLNFRRKLKMYGEQGMNKAISEIDILFSYLQDYCVHA